MYHPICDRCDCQLNELVLEFMGHPERVQLIHEYVGEKAGRWVNAASGVEG